ncbi:MAG: nuclear transport factor 2 family protein [Conexivisphaerales archaeon]|jgi:predicted SnoaL-like aldol condensation-catalyzing enzyme
MSVVKNKAVVRRFIKEVLVAGNVDAVDELLAPNYVNRSYGASNRAAFKGVLSGLKAAVPVREFKTENLLAEGNAVVFRGTMNATIGGKKVSARMITYYRLARGKIVEDDPISTPDLSQMLASMMPPPSHS